ncbi:hypothetical protein DFH09DRAFT_1284829 [Mycena vulgaris]|nr:hypothetical protein DFH09DRAFT_1284829 [Mycena vulgaris]
MVTRRPRPKRLCAPGHGQGVRRRRRPPASVIRPCRRRRRGDGGGTADGGPIDLSARPLRCSTRRSRSCTAACSARPRHTVGVRVVDSNCESVRSSRQHRLHDDSAAGLNGRAVGYLRDGMVYTRGAADDFDRSLRGVDGRRRVGLGSDGPYFFKKERWAEPRSPQHTGPVQPGASRDTRAHPHEPQRIPVARVNTTRLDAALREWNTSRTGPLVDSGTATHARGCGSRRI